ncbi:hypothetical protein AB0A71_33910, partial [Kitasatospora aureofaciens]|uniref:hypothetical protein n=1 Tax=Kitasatospora aureofaciens TaxID=1894 RepID=UPI003404DE3A
HMAVIFAETRPAKITASASHPEADHLPNTFSGAVQDEPGGQAAARGGVDVGEVDQGSSLPL